MNGGVTLKERYEEILRRLVEGLQAHYGPRLVSVAVFGSVGRGTQREDSDIDLLIVARDLPRGRTARVELMPVALSPVLKTPEEVEAGSPLFLDMVEDAQILHDEGGFLAAYLERL